MCIKRLCQVAQSPVCDTFSSFGIVPGSRNHALRGVSLPALLTATGRSPAQGSLLTRDDGARQGLAWVSPLVIQAVTTVHIMLGTASSFVLVHLLMSAATVVSSKDRLGPLISTIGVPGRRKGYRRSVSELRVDLG